MSRGAASSAGPASRGGARGSARTAAEEKEDDKFKSWVDMGFGFFEKGVAEHKLYIGNLDLRTREYHIIRAFKDYGKIVGIQMMWNKDGTPKGYCFVEMSTLDEATAARNALHNFVLLGRPMNVRFIDARLGEEALRKAGTRRGPVDREAVAGATTLQARLGGAVAASTSLSLEAKIRAIERKLDIALAGSTRAEPLARARFSAADAHEADYADFLREAHEAHEPAAAATRDWHVRK